MLTILTIKIVARTPHNGAEKSLEEITNHLLELGQEIAPNNRSGQLLKSLAYHLMATSGFPRPLVLV
jgi:hypothetical protein